MVEKLPGDEPVGPKRLGFMTGEIEVPDDFDESGAEEIVALFEGIEQQAERQTLLPAQVRAQAEREDGE